MGQSSDFDFLKWLNFQEVLQWFYPVLKTTFTLQKKKINHLQKMNYLKKSLKEYFNDFIQ